MAANIDKKAQVRDSYFELVLAYPLASIKSEQHLDKASQAMGRLLVKGKLDDGEEMYLDALSDLVGTGLPKCARL